MGFTAAAEVADIVGSSFAGDAAFTLGADAAASTPAFATAAGAADATAADLSGTGAAADISSPAIFSDIPGQEQGLVSQVGGEATQTAGYNTAGSTSVAGPNGTTITTYPDGSSVTLDSAGKVVSGTGGVSSQAGQIAASMAGTQSSIPGILGTVSQGTQLVGGLGQLYLMSQLLGGQGRVSPQTVDPYGAYRSTNAAQLNALLQNPNTITSTPGYQFNLSQGLNALQAQQAAQGRLVSGGALLQGQQWGQQFAQSNLQQQEQLLAQLSGATQSPATAATTQSNLAMSNLGQTALGLQAFGSGTANVLNPLATLYSQYNTPSPSVS
jgi:hypothetical protein